MEGKVFKRINSVTELMEHFCNNDMMIVYYKNDTKELIQVSEDVSLKECKDLISNYDIFVIPNNSSINAVDDIPKDKSIDKMDLPDNADSSDKILRKPRVSLKKMDHSKIVEIFNSTNQNISQTAKALDVSYITMKRYVKEHNMKPSLYENKYHVEINNKNKEENNDDNEIEKPI